MPDPAAPWDAVADEARYESWVMSPFARGIDFRLRGDVRRLLARWKRAGGLERRVVLDLCCGRGDATALAAGRVGFAAALDFSPKMLELGGEIADIVLLPTFTTAAFVKIARKRMAVGAAKSGRSVDTIPIGATLPFSVAEDEGEAREAVRTLTATYIANKVQNIRDDTLMQAAGLDESEARPIAETLQKEGPQAARRMVTNEIMDKVVIAGTPTQVTDKLIELSDAGLKWPLLYQVLGPDRPTAIRLVAQKVRPAFMRG